MNVIKQAGDGSTKFIAAVGPGASLGEMSLIDGQARFATCISTEPVDFAVLDRKALNEVLVSQPRLGNKLLLLLLQLMAKRLRDSSASLLRILVHRWCNGSNEVGSQKVDFSFHERQMYLAPLVGARSGTLIRAWPLWPLLDWQGDFGF